MSAAEGSHPDALHYRIGSVALRLTCPERRVRCDFQRLYGRFEVAQAPADAIELDVFRRRSRPWGAVQYGVRSAAGAQLAGGDVRAVIPELDDAISQQVIRCHSRFLQFHSGAMTWATGAMLFLAPSGTGKTTLAAALIQRGWGYLSDEFALVDLESSEVHPFPRALCLKTPPEALPANLAVAVGATVEVRRRSRYPAWYLAADCIRPGAVDGPRPLRCILFLTRTAAGAGDPRRVAPPEAAMRLYGEALNSAGLQRRGFEAVVDLARRIPCYEYNLGDVDRNCRVLQSLMEAAGPQALATTGTTG